MGSVCPLVSAGALLEELIINHQQLSRVLQETTLHTTCGSPLGAPLEVQA